MENNELLEIIKNCIKIFCKENCLNYVFDRNKIEHHNEFKEVNYVSLRQYWYNYNKNLVFEFSLVHYLGYPSKGEKERFGASVLICEYKDDELYRYFSLTDYLMYYHLKTIRFEECSGDTIKDKIIYYLDNVKEIILPILKGEVWLDSPTYWGNYK